MYIDGIGDTLNEMSQEHIKIFIRKTVFLSSSVKAESDAKNREGGTAAPFRRRTFPDNQMTAGEGYGELKINERPGRDGKNQARRVQETKSVKFRLQ